MDRAKKVIILLTLMMFLILLTILTVMIIIIMKEENNITNDTDSSNTVVFKEVTKTVKDVIEDHDSEYISQDNINIYAILAKNLFDEKGKSNEDFIRDLVDDLDRFFEDSSFYIIDEEKNITIYARRKSNGTLDIIINNNENFYNDVDGRDYIGVEKASIVPATSLIIQNPFLERLNMGGMYFSRIENYVTNGREMDDGYIVYTDQMIKLKLLPNKSILNIVFMEDYEDTIAFNISNKDKLRDVAELHEDYVFGGLDKGYLGYRSGNFYYFFYENEASVYSYTYKENKEFEALLTAYLDTGDLDEFANRLTDVVKTYVDYEYDPDIKKLFISYPTRGIEIKIKDNDPKGITLYSNYCFTDTTKNLVKSGKIQYSKLDFVNEYEQMRKEAE